MTEIVNGQHDLYTNRIMCSVFVLGEYWWKFAEEFGVDIVRNCVQGGVWVFNLRNLRTIGNFWKRCRTLSWCSGFQMCAGISTQHRGSSMLFRDLIQEMLGVHVSRGNKTTCACLWSLSTVGSSVSSPHSWGSSWPYLRSLCFVCVCVRETGRQRQKETEKGRDTPGSYFCIVYSTQFLQLIASRAFSDTIQKCSYRLYSHHSFLFNKFFEIRNHINIYLMC